MAAARRPRPVPGQAPGGRQGLSEAQVESQLRAQSYLCLVCEDPLGLGWAVDHSHRLAALHGHPASRGCARCFRGILCRACNLMLGMAKDRAAVLERGAAYLRLAGDSA